MGRVSRPLPPRCCSHSQAVPSWCALGAGAWRSNAGVCACAGEGASSSRGLVVLTPGFLVRSAAYASYLEALLAQGVAACTWDVTDQSPTHAMDDVDSVRVSELRAPLVGADDGQGALRGAAC